MFHGIGPWSLQASSSPMQKFSFAQNHPSALQMSTDSIHVVESLELRQNFFLWDFFLQSKAEWREHSNNLFFLEQENISTLVIYYLKTLIEYSHWEHRKILMIIPTT